MEKIVTLVASGPVASGKSTLLRMIEELLKDKGIKFESNPIDNELKIDLHEWFYRDQLGENQWKS